MDRQAIKTKAELGLPLTEQERAIYLLFIATAEQAQAFLQREQHTA